MAAKPPVSAQLVDIELRRTKIDTKIRHVTHFVHDGGHMQQGLGRNAAHVQADPAQRGIALHQHDLEAEIGGAERRAVATRAAAEHEHVALKVGTAAEAGRLRRRRRRRDRGGGWG
jgi:hypothetical protein